MSIIHSRAVRLEFMLKRIVTHSHSDSFPFTLGMHSRPFKRTSRTKRYRLDPSARES